MTKLTGLRKTWVPLIKIAVSSSADIYGDWLFYRSVIKDENRDISDKYALPVQIFFYVAVAMGVLTIGSLLVKGSCSAKNPDYAQKPTAWGAIVRFVRKVLALEILLEDIPQFVLSALVTYDRGAMTGKTIINITTSAYNFVFNILDMLDVHDDDDDGGEAGVVVSEETPLRTEPTEENKAPPPQVDRSEEIDA